MKTQKFHAWWQEEGRRLCQSLLVVTENISVEDKVSQIFEAARAYEVPAVQLTAGLDSGTSVLLKT